MIEPVGLAALTTTVDDTHVEPATLTEWDAWVAAGKTRNWLEDDPLLDWLDRYGAAKGYLPDTELDGYDPRTDMRRFVLEQGHRFEDGVIALIRDRLPTIRIADGWRDARELNRAVATVEEERHAPTSGPRKLHVPTRGSKGACRSPLLTFRRLRPATGIWRSALHGSSPNSLDRRK